MLGAEDRHRRSNHRLGERADPEPGGRRHGARVSQVCDTAVGRDPLSVPDDPDCRPRDPLRRRVPLEKDGKRTLIHGPSVVRVECVLAGRTTREFDSSQPAGRPALAQTAIRAGPVLSLDSPK